MKVMEAEILVHSTNGTAMSRASCRGRRTRSPLQTGGTSTLKVDAVIDVRAVQLLAALQPADHRRLQVLHERLRLVLLGEVEVEAARHQLAWRGGSELTSMVRAAACRLSRIIRCSSHSSVRLCSV